MTTQRIPDTQERPRYRPALWRLNLSTCDYLRLVSCFEGGPARIASPLAKGVALGLAGMALMLALPAAAQDEPVLAIAVGEPGSTSYEVGHGLAALLETEGLPDGTKTRAEIWESLTPDQRVSVLFEEVQVAVLPAGEPALQTPRAQEDVEAAVSLADGEQVVVRKALSDDLVYELTRLIFEHPDALRSAAPDLGDLEPGASLARIKGAVHPGALRYYEERGVQQAAAPPADAGDQGTEPPEGKSFLVYFDFDVSDFDMGQIDIVENACGYAAGLPSAEFILAGHADTMGPEPYNDWLSLARAQSVAEVIRGDPRFHDALHVITFGERRPAVPSGDEMLEPKNRRVLITVVPGKVDPADAERISAAAGPPLRP